jgi:hypothetical protein
MKKLLLITILLISAKCYSQVFDEPYDSTTHYKLRLYEQGARSSAIVLNNDKRTIDSVLYSLITYTDPNQFVILNDSILTFAEGFSGIGTFSGTDAQVTVTLDSISTGDVVLLTPIGGTHNANDLLRVSVTNGSFTVTRGSSGTSGLTFFYIWIRRTYFE